MITDNVKKALEEYKQTVDSIMSDEKAVFIREEIDSLNEQLDDLLKRLGEIEIPFRTKLNEIEEYIKVQALEIATSFEHAGVKVSYVSGYDRVTWTKKAMDELCLQNPALLSVLAPARKIKWVDPRVNIAILETDKEPKESPG